jgi:multimeric flavodoxin WrbA
MVLRVLVIYYSPGGNTKRTAEALCRGLVRAEAEVTLVPLHRARGIALDDYDLVCLGCPAYHFAPPAPVRRALDRRIAEGNAMGRVVPNAPRCAGRTAVVFVTYAGPHTGIAEATPVGDVLAQTFRHLGYGVRGVWYTVGAFHENSNPRLNLYGRLGDIRGRPNAHDLGVIEANAYGLATVLRYEKAEREKRQGRHGDA